MSTIQRLATRELSVPACVAHLNHIFPPVQARGEAGKLADGLNALDRRHTGAPLPHFCAAQALALVEQAGTARSAADFVKPLAGGRQVAELRQKARALGSAGQLSADETRAYLHWVDVADRAQRSAHFNDSVQEGSLKWPWRLSCLGAFVGGIGAVTWAAVALDGVFAATAAGGALALGALCGAWVVGFAVPMLPMMALSLVWQHTAWGASGA